MLYVDASEVSVLVEFAMGSAGDGDLESDRVSSLQTATSAFKPIIFDLETNHDFNALMEKLDAIWHALDEDERLPEQLVSEMFYNILNMVLSIVILITNIVSAKLGMSPAVLIMYTNRKSGMP